jgi:hypothetical protein
MEQGTSQKSKPLSSNLLSCHDVLALLSSIFSLTPRQMAIYSHIHDEHFFVTGLGTGQKTHTVARRNGAIGFFMPSDSNARFFVAGVLA